MTKLSATIISLFLTLQIVGQPLKVIKQLLADNKFQSFKTFIDSAPKSNSKLSWETLREVTPGFWEGVVKLETFKEVIDKTGGNIINYRIDLLATEQNIFFYQLSEIRYTEIKVGEWQSYDSTLEKYKNDVLFKDFETTFSKAYHANLNPKELFITSIVYGSECGIAATPTQFQEKLDSLLLDKDIKTISSWLKSPNTEKQIYAIQGLKVLEKNGYNLTPEEMRLIKIIKQKKGVVNTCAGCLYSSDTIKNVIAGIESWEGYFTASQRANKSNKFFYSVLSVLILIIALLLFYFKYFKPWTKKDGVQHSHWL